VCKISLLKSRASAIRQIHCMHVHNFPFQVFGMNPILRLRGSEGASDIVNYSIQTSSTSMCKFQALWLLVRKQSLLTLASFPTYWKSSVTPVPLINFEAVLLISPISFPFVRLRLCHQEGQSGREHRLRFYHKLLEDVGSRFEGRAQVKGDEHFGEEGRTHCKVERDKW